MRRHKKLIVAVGLASVLLFGIIGGIALADEEGNGPAARFGGFIDIDNVIDKYEAKGYTIESPEALKEAFAEARTEMAEERAQMRAAKGDRPEMDSEAMKERLDALLDEGKITQDQYDKIIERWESMPDDWAGFGLRGPGHFPGRFGPCAPSAGE